ncbi:MAG: ATP-dependent DNA helicase DinG [Gammaproteobacteria bacterium]|nr:ATP-dependent DNA helicase DinG [Gammaproteobacteria bacterium]MDD9960450.1 ATP-dependent DNA helicase DinG [Gammaproteobacteria bacterium]
MLADEVKDRIQTAYRQLLESRDLTPRYGQRQMIAEIARTLAVLASDEDVDTPICVIEAGTGTGKTLAYLLAVLPLAQELGYKVVIATATVALQEQVIFKDIPEILEGSDLEFKVSLAKGRGRYLCLSKLDMLLAGSDSLQAMMDLYGEELEDPDSGDTALYEDMLNELGAGNWQGDRDDWKTPISDANWRPLTVDRYQCTGSNCSNFRNCCFYNARDSLDKVDCIVSNHDLVLTDLAMGGGVILPEPEKCIYIFDEAHHLPFKSNNHFSAYTRIKASLAWLERCENLFVQLAKEEFLDADRQEQLQRIINSIRDHSDDAWSLLEQTIESLGALDSYENRSQHAFELGIVPDAIREVAQNLGTEYTRLSSGLQDLASELRQIMDDGVDLEKTKLAEQWYPILGTNTDRAEANLELWLSYAQQDPEGSAPRARWLSFTENEGIADIGLSSSPVLAAENLQERLWQNCAGAVLTSATLSALGEFTMLRLRAGLPEQTHYLSIPSPFDFSGSASLVVPRMNCEPSETEKHTEYIINAIPQLLKHDSAALMLFSSRRQMNEVMQSLPREWLDLILCQDDYQKAQLLKYHRQRVDRGEGSIIFGLASFAEGVDLPGKYCTHVLIAKIPFAVPNDPIEMTLSAWIEQQGQNAFMTLAVPDAAFRLVQASGRLLRSETDSGRITLFDERIVNKRYGKTILESMPPYRREIFQDEFPAEN